MAGFLSNLFPSFLGTQSTRATLLDGLEPIPNFEALGIADEHQIREELRRGPCLTFLVGPDKAQYTAPLRLFCYYSPVSMKVLKQSPCLEAPIDVSTECPVIFSKLLTWLHEGKLCGEEFSIGLIDAVMSSGSNLDGIQEYCNTLCMVHLLAYQFCVPDLQKHTLSELASASSRAADYGQPVTLRPDTVIRIYKIAGPKSAIWKAAVREIKKCCVKNPQGIATGDSGSGLGSGDWEECLDICKELKGEIAKAVVARIYAGWNSMAEDEAWDGADSPVVDEGRPAGWWQGEI